MSLVETTVEIQPSFVFLKFYLAAARCADVPRRYSVSVGYVAMARRDLLDASHESSLVENFLHFLVAFCMKPPRLVIWWLRLSSDHCALALA